MKRFIQINNIIFYVLIMLNILILTNINFTKSIMIKSDKMILIEMINDNKSVDDICKKINNNVCRIINGELVELKLSDDDFILDSEFIILHLYKTKKIIRFEYAKILESRINEINENKKHLITHKLYLKNIIKEYLKNYNTIH